ncbi:MAG TPA: DUF3450 family protein [Verrucomicrobiae bacterium]|nr:DUF3450 family protein [Verrucomicrobiae bacterium]
MMLRCLYALSCALLVFTRASAAGSSLSQTRSTLEKWVETRQLVSKTKADWLSDRETLQQIIALYERELAGIDDQMSRITTNNTQVAREMSEASAVQKLSHDSLDSTRLFLGEFEARVKTFLPQLPAPLQDILKPLASRMPADPATTKMLAAERMQVLVGILGELDKFNNAVNLFNEKRRNAAGDEVSVQTIYVGLGAAYFVNETGDFAGIGKPGSSGWEWNSKPEIAAAVQEVVKIYRSERTARFVSLPASVQ